MNYFLYTEKSLSFTSLSGHMLFPSLFSVFDFCSHQFFNQRVGRLNILCVNQLLITYQIVALVAV